MESMDYWRLCDELSVVQAALLIVGEDPSSKQYYVDNWAPEKRPTGFDAAMAALRNAITSLKLSARYTGVALQSDEEQEWHRTIVGLADLREWLTDQGFSNGFFFPTRMPSVPDYLDRNHPRYAPKLAASVNAWLSLEDESLLSGKTPKQALMRWLREHASEFKLSNQEGKPNEQGIQECAKVANWKEKGGAPKTP